MPPPNVKVVSSSSFSSVEPQPAQTGVRLLHGCLQGQALTWSTKSVIKFVTDAFESGTGMWRRSTPVTPRCPSWSKPSRTSGPQPSQRRIMRNE